MIPARTAIATEPVCMCQHQWWRHLSEVTLTYAGATRPTGPRGRCMVADCSCRHFVGFAIDTDPLR